MANKYSKYQITPFVSNYVDPASIQVNEILRERFDKNRAGKDLIDRTLNSMEVMQGDQVILQDVKDNVRNILGSVYEQGNYEDAGLLVQDAASFVDGNSGLLAAKKSMANRQLELDFIKQERMKGNYILDFGGDAVKGHSSYYFDKETEINALADMDAIKAYEKTSFTSVSKVWDTVAEDWGSDTETSTIHMNMANYYVAVDPTGEVHPEFVSLTKD